ncbi:MAG: hypothetical protein ACT4O9_15540 [Blastocatellia bacterium]
MKTILRFAGMGMLLAAFLAVGATAGFAQDNCADVDGYTALDAKIRENYPKRATKKIAVEAGKQYLEKYGACEPTKDFADWLKVQVPKWEIQDKEYQDALWLDERFTRFNAAVPNDKYDEAYAAGKEILTKQPNNVHIILPLGLIGLYQSYNKNYNYNDDTIRFANMAIAKLKSGAEGKVKDGKPVLDKNGKPVYGVFQFEMNKEDAISELTYAIAYINYWAKNDKKSALPFYYEVSQLPGRNQKEPRVFATVGSYYLEEAGKLGTEIAALIKKLETATTDEEKLKLDGEAKAKVGLFNGYTERAMDAFGRARSVAPDKTPAEKKYKDDINKTLQDLYKRRFEKVDGLDTWISASVAKPFPNPTSEVAPIIDPEPETTTTTTTTSGTEPAPANGTAKPAVTTAKPLTTGTKAAATKPATNGAKATANGAKTVATKPKRR